LKNKQQFVCYDGFEPSGRMHIAQGIMRKINVNRITKAGGVFTFWVADWFAKLNHKMGGDLEKIKVLGKYFIEVWRASGMDLKNVRFLWASDVIQKNSDSYWPRVLDIATKNTLARIVKCSQIMGRKEQDTLSASQIIYPCMQCSDIIQLGADMCQLGLDQRKVNVLALEYFDAIGKSPKPVIVSHHMLLGLQQNADSNEPTKMSKSNPDAAIFMEDEPEDVARKIKRAYCPEKIVHLNPILEYVKYIIFGTFNEMVVKRKEANGGDKTYTKYEDLEADYVSGALHPGDLKPAVIEYINKILVPVREHFKNDAYARGLLEKVIQYRKEEKENKEKEQKEKGKKTNKQTKKADTVEKEVKPVEKTETKAEVKTEITSEEEKKAGITVPIPQLPIAPRSFGGRTRINHLMKHYEEYIDKIIYVAGWGKTLRFTKNVAFIELSDGSGPLSLQVVVDTNMPNYAELEKLRSGCSLGFKGKIVKSIGSKQLIEMQVKNMSENYIKIYGDCPADQYPLAKKEHTVEV
jgi:tyrosyl-tRNA synthetase